MKGLALSGGDLVVGQGGYTTLTGGARIRQDLALALAEPYGDDPWNPQWGSVLPNYIGAPLDAQLQLLVRSEVVRVLQQYVAAQAADIATDALSGSRSRYSYGDVVAAVLSVNTVVNYDSLQVAIALQTQAGEQVALVRTVDL